ncbi:MAG: TldD/PmbA family protein [bacterium]|nr:TldD/PmbA family protein [bacterium]
MKHEEIAHFLLEELQRKGADDVVLQLNTGENTLIKFSNNKISTTKTWESTNLSIFVTKDQKLLNTSLKSFDKEHAKRSAENIIKIITKMQANKDYKGIAQGPFKYRTENELYDKKIEDMNEEMIDLVKQAIDTARKKTKRTAGTFEKTVGESYLLTSNNVEAREKGSGLYFSIRTFIDKNSSGYGSCVSRIKNKLKILQATEHATQIAKEAHRPKKAMSGKFDVIFAPHAMAAIVERLADNASIFSVESGLSCLKNQLGKKIANEQVSLYDDATIANGYGSTIFDAEGTPTQRTPIIEKGILKNYLHNASTAKRYKTKSTGNAGLISPRIFSVSLKEGKQNKEELFSQIKKGIYITNVWYTRFQNHETGDFSTIPRDGAFYIENGKIKTALKDIRISENMLKLIKNISVLSNECTQIKSWEVETPTFVPYALVKDVNITKPN